MKEAPRKRNGWYETVTQPTRWAIFSSDDLCETRWGSANEALRNPEHCQLTLKLRLAPTAREPVASDMHRRVLAIAQLHPQSAFEIADMVAGGSVAASMMGRASLGASWAVGFGQDQSQSGPRSIKSSPGSIPGSIKGPEARWHGWRRGPSQCRISDASRPLRAGHVFYGAAD